MLNSLKLSIYIDKNINFDKRLRKRGGSLIYYCTRGFAKGVEVESIIARGIHLLKSFLISDYICHLKLLRN